jgi:putative hydroxymethylpyrimidine transport system substrate-binding protein
MKHGLLLYWRPRWLIAVFAVVTITLGTLVVSCGENGSRNAGSITTIAAGPTPLEEVSLMMDWIPWVLDIPVDVAQHNGFYERQGLEVTQIIPVEAADIAKFVSTERSQFGLYYAPDVLMARETGAALVCVGSLMSHAPVGMALRPGFDADSPKALAGKVVSVPLVPSTRASFASMLEVVGLAPESVAVTDPGFELVAPVLTGAVDAGAFTEFGELVQAEMESGEKLVYLDFRDWGTPDFAFLNIITTDEFARARPEKVRGFVRATLEGLVYAAANPEKAVSLYVEAHPELDEELLLAQWKAAAPFLGLAAAGRPAGFYDHEDWEKLGEWMLGTGLLEEAVDVGAAFTNEFLEGGR